MKRSYHTDIMIKYKLGVLEPGTIEKIPSSTLFNWKNKDFSQVFGLPDVNDSEIDLMREFLTRKKLMQAAKALYFLFLTYKSVVNNFSNKKKLFYDLKELIVDTIDRTKEILGFDRVLNIFDISVSTYYYWKYKVKCSDSLLKLCRIKHPLQLTVKEVKTIKRHLTDLNYIHWSLSSVYYKMQVNKAAFMHLSTFYKYARLLKLSRRKPGNRRKKYKIGIRAKKVLQILHADLTIYRPLDNTKVYIYFIADNFSRKILAWKASLEYSAKYTFENLKEVYEKYNLEDAQPEIDFMVDGGSENKAEVDVFINSANINKVIAQKDTIFSNSMIEAVNKRIKYDFLFPVALQDFKQTVKQLEKAVPEYNNKPYQPLYGLTPNEVSDGKVPDKNMFSEEIAKAKMKRIEENRKNPCSSHK